jgi:hypothetical protein
MYVTFKKDVKTTANGPVEEYRFRGCDTEMTEHLPGDIHIPVDRVMFIRWSDDPGLLREYRIVNENGAYRFETRENATIQPDRVLTRQVKNADVLFRLDDSHISIADITDAGREALPLRVYATNKADAQDALAVCDFEATNNVFEHGVVPSGAYFWIARPKSNVRYGILG